ncbi:MAG: hypothetical protein Q8Q14_06110 [Gemmatimonadales bacterium]|nr:hypothetical protein [Gemmatimonadales bacterium]
MGDPWRKMLNSTFNEFDPVTIEMLYDDTASTGPWVLFNDIGGPTPTDGRELKVTFGSTKTVLIKTIIESVERTLEIGNLHRLTAVLKHFGGAAPTEA